MGKPNPKPSKLEVQEGIHPDKAHTKQVEQITLKDVKVIASVCWVVGPNENQIPETSKNAEQWTLKEKGKNGPQHSIPLCSW